MCGSFDPSARMRFHAASYSPCSLAEPPPASAPTLNEKDEFFGACCALLQGSGGLEAGHIGGCGAGKRNKYAALEQWLGSSAGRAFLDL